MDQLTVLLQEELESLTGNKSAIEATLLASRKRLGEIEIRIRHIEGLLNPNIEHSDSTWPPKGMDRPDIADLAEQVLSEKSPREIHYKTLAREVRLRGGLLKGKRPEAALIARLVSDLRFVRPSKKGYYALRKDYPAAKNVGSRRRRS